MRRSSRLSLLLLATLAAACDSSSTPLGPSAADVAGRYAVCELAFVPAGALPRVDVAAAVFEVADTSARAPELRVDPISNNIQLVYTPKGGLVEHDVRGTYSLKGDRVTLHLQSERNALLLPEQLPLDFQPSPQQLSVTSPASYSVPRADYVRLSGHPEANLAPQIEGQLAATFRVGGCS